jgi:hypothetical protein
MGLGAPRASLPRRNGLARISPRNHCVLAFLKEIESAAEAEHTACPRRQINHAGTISSALVFRHIATCGETRRGNLA